MRPVVEGSAMVVAVRTEKVVRAVIPGKTTTTSNLPAATEGLRWAVVEAVVLKPMAAHEQRMIPPATTIVEVQVF